jgi:glycosyltransferase involved in cell wall biosynthesis
MYQILHLQMTISGFSYVRNGLEYGYPFLEAIQSILPVCNEFVIAVGDSIDGTRQAIEALSSPKIKIIDTVWDMNLREGGKIFAEQANVALDACTSNWAFHIQADEVIHEKDLPAIKAAIEKYNSNKRVEGFILPFIHFWGGYDYFRTSRRVHNHEVRIFRNDTLVRSYADSQGFRKYSSIEAYEQGEKGEKLRVKKIAAPIFHYSGVRPKHVQKKKMYTFDLLHEGAKSPEAYEQFDFGSVDRVEKFTGSHPKLMKEKVEAQDWEFHFDPKKAVWKTKDKFLQPIEDFLGFKFGEYKNYKEI